MKNWLSLAFCATMALCASCEKKQNTVRVEKIDGVECIHNGIAPAHPQRTVTFVHELALGEKEEDKLFQPGAMAVSTDGRIFISDRADMTIKVYDANGAFLRAIGHMGDGPGEFKGIMSMLFSPDGHLFVLDSQLRRLSVFSNQGDFIKSCQLTHPMYRLYLLSDSTFTGDINVYGETSQLYVKTLRLDGSEICSYGQFKPAEMKILRQNNVSFGISLPYPVHSILIGDPQQRWLYHCQNDQYLIEVYDHTGRLFRKIDRPYTAIDVNDKDREDYYSGFSQNSNPIFIKMAHEVELPKKRTIVDLLLADERGNLWIKTNEEKEETGKTLMAYDLFDKQGIYQTRLWTDLEPRLFVNGQMYTRQSDKETEAVSIHRYRVQWSE